MPTAGRLAGAVFLAVLAYIVSVMCQPLFPDDNIPDQWMLYNVGMGIIIGWVVMGPRSGGGFGAAIGIGLTGAILWAFWALFVHSFRDMINESFRKTYDGAVEALVDIFQILIEYGALLGSGPVIGALLGGGIVVGILTDVFARNFR